MSEETIVVVSGGFDPIHVGHIRMIQDAAKLGDRLVVVINNDNWLKTKKGHAFMPEEQRKEIIEALEGVNEVLLTRHEPDCEDMSVCHMLEDIEPDIFANGGDRFADNIPEAILAKEKGIECVFNVGRGGKVQSSSWLTAEDREDRECFCESGERYIHCHGK